mmetsp:Transcript_107343/g.308961  ORF Transcript_107343/g.308961 Transcript_107343/m.308961 type:complete len:362 (+) Transcript_107343:47-1132(+)
MAASVRAMAAARLVGVMALLCAARASCVCSISRPCSPTVVIVTTFDGEYRHWHARLPLTHEVDFPDGATGIPLGWNPELRVVGVVTGIGPRNSTLSVTALGHDPRFDLTACAWLVVGISGFDPQRASIGSAAWARYLVDGDAVRYIDPREAPPDWPTGWTPVNRQVPYGLPAPTEADRDGIVYQLSARLLDFALGLSGKVALPDSDALLAARAPYAAAFPGGAGRAPRVLPGDGLTTGAWWVGELSAAWARNWTRYWTGGVGEFTHSSMEDTGIAVALAALARAGRARGPAEGLLVLRSASNFVQPPPGQPPAEFKMVFDPEAGFAAGYAAALPVVMALATAPIAGGQAQAEMMREVQITE